jgi:hypothetical protein
LERAILNAKGIALEHDIQAVAAVAETGLPDGIIERIGLQGKDGRIAYGVALERVDIRAHSGVSECTRKFSLIGSLVPARKEIAHTCREGDACHDKKYSNPQARSGA